MAIRTFAVLSVLVSVALAQSSSPYVPQSGISDTCSKFLLSLNTNAALVNCTTPFTTALAAFSTNASATPSSSTINSALTSLCGDNTFVQCPESTITTQLASFYAACEPELTSSDRNTDVEMMYEVLYLLWPFRDAICAKDDNGQFCAAELSNSSTTAGVGALAGSGNSQQAVLNQYLSVPVGSTGASARRDTSNTTNALSPNATTFASTNILFLFRQASWSTDKLCTTCTRNIMTPYISFESSYPFAPGINNSQLLAGQVALYTNISDNCPSGFLGGAVQAAGGLSSGLVPNSASRPGGQELSAAVGAILGVAAFVATVL